MADGEKKETERERRMERKHKNNSFTCSL